MKPPISLILITPTVMVSAMTAQGETNRADGRRRPWRPWLRYWQSRLQSRVAIYVRALLAGLAAGAALAAAATPPLRAYHADLSQTSVSGLSSGAFMAGQFGVAYSSIVVGTGVVAGGPYFCSGYQGSVRSYSYLSNAMSICMNPAASGVAPPDAGALWDEAKILATVGAIDNLAGVRRQHIYLFSGTQDHTVTQAVVDQTLRFYQLAGVPAAQIEYVNNVAAGHGMVVDDNSHAAVACDVTAPPYLNDCHFSQAHQLLRHLYADQVPPLAPPATTLSSTVKAFDQTEFSPYLLSGLADVGYVYVPKNCELTRCKVHVVFHGCKQDAQTVGATFYDGAEYNGTADSNNLIVLYPQVHASYWLPYNPQGCWDFWGYSSFNPFNPDFYSKNAPQLASIRAMLARLAAPR
jgi:poly(3-hydroxybutyrate) depolymerase